MPRRLFPQRSRPCMKTLRRRAVLRRVNRLIDWELMRVFGYEGNASILGFQKGIEVCLGPFNGMVQWERTNPDAFLLWAVSTSPMVWQHVMNACRRAGYPFNPNAPVSSPRVFFSRRVVVSLLGHCLKSTQMGEVGERLAPWAAALILEELGKWGLRIGKETPGWRGLPLEEDAATLDEGLWPVLESMGLAWTGNPVNLLWDACCLPQEMSSPLEQENRRIRRLQYLQSKGVLAKGVGTNGYPAFALALVTPGTTRRVWRQFIHQGADPHACMPADRRAGVWHVLMQAIARAYCPWPEKALRERFSFLRHLGVNPNVPDGKGQMPLHVLLSHPPRTVFPEGLIEAFVRCGGNPDKVDREGKTALDLALDLNHGLAGDLLRHRAVREKEDIGRALGVREGNPAPCRPPRL